MPRNARNAGLTTRCGGPTLKSDSGQIRNNERAGLRQEILPMKDFPFDVHIFKEGNTYVAHVPALDVSSCGATGDEARRNIRDAVRGFLEASAKLGTLDEILQEAGYEREGEKWHAPEFVSVDRLTMSLK
jgi:predicted RNase H-like HicB family nuclease